MYKNLKSAIVVGIEGIVIDVEIHSSNGLPNVTIVGLPDTALCESKERVRSAIYNSGFEFPLKRITVNLAPAYIKKEHAFLDLPIALGILSASNQLNEIINLDEYIIIGELTLKGNLLSLKGILPIAIKARELGLKLIAPIGNVDEIKIIDGLEYYVFNTLNEVIEFISKRKYTPNNLNNQNQLNNIDISKKNTDLPDFKDVIGQSYAKRALEVAAAGGHAILMRGVPGSGKTMLATCLPKILPNMTFEESLEVSKIYSIAGLLKNGKLINKRTFRMPHHTISEVAMIGGSRIPRPGEVSLAHNGVLFLDEFTEYKQSVIEALRQPLSYGYVTISRAYATYTYPAKFMLVAACNPCPCGYLGDNKIQCRCTSSAIKKYAMKFSGPIIDRIDIQIDVKRVDINDIKNAINLGKVPESSEVVAKRVSFARKLQIERFNKNNFLTSITTYSNANMTIEQVKEYCNLHPELNKIFHDYVEKNNISMRSYNKILKVARTIADLNGNKNIERDDLLEAMQYRISI